MENTADGWSESSSATRFGFPCPLVEGLTSVMTEIEVPCLNYDRLLNLPRIQMRQSLQVIKRIFTVLWRYKHTNFSRRHFSVLLVPGGVIFNSQKVLSSSYKSTCTPSTPQRSKRSACLSHELIWDSHFILKSNHYIKKKPINTNLV